MSKFKKIVALILSIVFILSSMPLSLASADNLQIPVVDNPTTEKEKVLVPDPTFDAPEGYHFSGRDYTDENGRVYYYIESEPSEYGLTTGYWVDSDGKRARDPNPVTYSGNGVLDEPETFPASYDARNDNIVPPVTQQGATGTCWAHSSIASLEINAVKQGFADAATVDLCEFHTVKCVRDDYYEGVDDSRNDGPKSTYDTQTWLGLGGNAADVARVLGNFNGAANESDYNIRPSRTQYLYPTQIAPVLDAMTFNDKFNRDITLDYYTEAGTPKGRILNYGSTVVYYLTNLSEEDGTRADNLVNGRTTVYHSAYHNINHAVLIVGWDDNFPKEDFTDNLTGEHPKNDGAWLIRNSWGLADDNGYFWLSYEDATINMHGSFVAADPRDVANIYMYDGMGNNTSVSSHGAASVFTANGSEYLSKVSLGNKNFNGDYTLEIYTDIPTPCTDPTTGTLVYTQSGHAKGQFIDVTGNVNFAAGQRFSVVIKYSGTSMFEGPGSSTYSTTSHTGETFYLNTDDSWIDSVSDNKGNGCIRAFTKDYSPLSSYKIKFVDGEKEVDTVYSNGDTVTLPHDAGLTYSFERGGSSFDGTNIDRDMTVNCHAYPTNGLPSSYSVCVTEFKCKYCNAVMQNEIVNHNYVPTVTAPTATTVGYTTHTCSVCGMVYHDTPTSIYTDAEIGELKDGMWWMYRDGTLYITGSGDMPDFASTNAEPWISHANDITNIVLQEGITSIGRYNFSTLQRVATLNLPSSLTKIGMYSFYCWYSLTELTMPENLTTIDNYAFANCSDLTNIVYNDKISTMNYGAFAYCSSLTSVSLPATVTKYDTPFSSCPNIKTLTIEEGITTLSAGVWSGYYIGDTLDNLILPSTLQSISNWTFVYYTTTKNVTIPEDNQYFAVDDKALYSKDMTKLIMAFNGKYQKVLSVPSSVTQIGEYAFKSTNSNYVDLSTTAAQDIADYTFRDYSNSAGIIKRVNLPANLTSIGYMSFAYLKKLTTIFIPSTVTSINKNAFYKSYDVSSLTKVYTDSETSAAKSYADSVNIECVTNHTTHAYTDVLDTLDDGSVVLGCECGSFKVCKFDNADPVPAALKSAATCKDKAVYYYSCSICGDVNRDDTKTFEYGDTIPHTIVTDPAVQATCKATGLTEGSHCSVCGDVITAQTVTPKTAHTFGDYTETTPSTCKTAGVETRTCSVCGVTETRATAKKSHTVVTDPAVQATCKATGLTEGSHCSVCGDVITAQTVTPKTAHTFGGYTETTPSTCKTAGVETRTCSVCGATETRATAKKSHTVVTDPAVQATCKATGLTEGSHCSVCGDVITAQTVTPKTAHTFGGYTETTPSTCKTAGVETRTCSVCGATETRATAKKSHTVVTDPAVQATCKATGLTEGSHCSVCGDVITAQTVTPKTAHTFGDYTETTPSTCKTAGVETRTCSVCGATETRATAKTSHCDNDGDKICDICGDNLDPSKTCTHICHKTDGWHQFWYKFARLFWKLFKVKQYCECGAKHY